MRHLMAAMVAPLRGEPKVERRDEFRIVCAIGDDSPIWQFFVPKVDTGEASDDLSEARHATSMDLRGIGKVAGAELLVLPSQGARESMQSVLNRSGRLR